ncbi:MAG: lysoplasmalogenase family protein [Chitinophagaceae bacterium]
MRLIKKNGIVIFWFFLIVDCLFIFLDQLFIANIFKALLVPLLLLYLIVNARKKVHYTSRTYFYSGLFFCWLGNLFLMGNSDTFFLLGMLAFLFAQLIYALAFYHIRPIDFSKSYQSLIAAILMTAIMIPFYFLIESFLEVYKIPVILFMIVISLMVIFATNVLQSVTKRSLAYSYFIPGTILLVMSDMILAINKFYLAESFLNVVVILSYGYAQALIVEGFCKILKS